jgi:putative ABC transport system permease protein
MLYQNIKFAIRYIVSNKIYSILNLTGLVLGLALSLVVYLIICQEISYNRFHSNVKQIYQIMQYERKETGSFISPGLTDKTAESLKQEVPDFEVLTKIPAMPAPPLMINGHSLNEAGIFADASLFRIFSFKLAKGNGNNVLELKRNIIISERLAAKYFPDQDPTGKIINTQGSAGQFFTVAGLLKDIPVNSTLQFDYIIPYQNFSEGAEKDSPVNVYVKINSNTSPSVLNEKISSMASESDFKKDRELFMFPFSKVHILPVKYKDATAGGMIGAIIGLSVLGFLILLVACINYTNLATALSLKRAKNTGIKKIFGSARNSLTFQFLLESFILTFIAMILGLVVANLIVPWFNRSFGWNLRVDYTDPVMFAGLFAILLLTSLLSGTYPAFYLSRLNPLQILKGSDTKGRNRKGLRKVLVVVQFFFASLLIIISVTCIKQIRYIKNKDLGVNIEDMIIFRLNKNLLKYCPEIKDEVSRLTSVRSVAYVSENPLFIWNETSDISYDGKVEEIPPFRMITADFDFVRTLDLKLKGGRDFDSSLSTDSTNILLNETAAKILGSSGKVGTRLKIADKEGTIIGIINDYHMTHMNFPIKPMLISCYKNSNPVTLVKFNPGMSETGVGQIKSIVEKFEKDSGTNYMKMRDAFEDIYRENVFKIGKLSIIFSLLALWIACLGLIGLSMFNAEMRTKEIGVHRVHGAGIFKVIKMLTVEYVYRVILSLIFAVPAGYLVINKLFSRTAYHTDLSISIFVLAGIIVLLIAYCTAGWQAYRLALKNPAETLKYE